MKLHFEINPENGDARVNVKLRDYEIPFVARRFNDVESLFSAVSGWLIDHCSETFHESEEMPEITLITKLFKFNEYESEEEENEGSTETNEPKNTPMPKFMTDSVSDIFGTDKEDA